MAAPKIEHLEGEVLTALCIKCKCCLSDNGHCWQCHVTMPIQKICGCGNCPDRIKDYKERFAMQTNIKNIRRMARNAA
jgi:hypothetical protein